MAVRALQIWATVVAGDTPVGTRVFSLGGPPESLTLGTAGTWTIHAEGVTQIHAKLHFDGERLAIAPVGEITIQGATIPRSGTILEAPVEIVMGGARIVFLQRAKVTRTVRSLKGAARKRKGDDAELAGSRALEATTSPRAVLRQTPSKAFSVGSRVGRDADTTGSGPAAGLRAFVLAVLAPSVARAAHAIARARRRVGPRGEVVATCVAGALLILGATVYAVHVPARTASRGVAERAHARPLASASGATVAPSGEMTRVALATPAPLSAPFVTAGPPLARAPRRAGVAAGSDLRIPIERAVVDAIARGDDHEAARLLEGATSAGPPNATYAELLRILNERAERRR